MLRLRRIMTSVDPALTVIPLVPDARMEAIPFPSMVIDFVMVTGPYPPGSRTSISPPALVLEIAAAKVLHGAVRLHGLASSPTPETNVRLGAEANVAVTFSAMLMVTTQLPVPLHAPLHPAKTKPLCGVAVSVTRVPPR